jgi:hypothetical protein
MDLNISTPVLNHPRAGSAIQSNNEPISAMESFRPPSHRNSLDEQNISDALFTRLRVVEWDGIVELTCETRTTKKKMPEPNAFRVEKLQERSRERVNEKKNTRKVFKGNV